MLAIVVNNPHTQRLNGQTLDEQRENVRKLKAGALQAFQESLYYQGQNDPARARQRYLEGAEFENLVLVLEANLRAAERRSTFKVVG